MKSHHIFKGAILIGLLSVLTLSSFHKPDARDEGIDSESKSTQHKGRLSLSSSFENDYYTRNNRTGHFYAELLADQYHGNSEKHTPLNISVVIDRSGSMAGDKIRNAKEAAKFIVDQLGPQDYLSVVIYDGSVDVLQSATPVVNKYLIKNKIDGIMDRGGTNLMGGAMEGYTQVKRYFRSNAVNRVLLLSDGLANQGITDPSQILGIVMDKSRNDGISISTFGVGLDYNEDLMTSMAERGAGNYYFIDRPDQIAGIFSKEINGLNQVIAQQANLKITIPEYVNIEKVYGATYEQRGRILTIPFHDIFSGETKSVLIRYTVQAGRNMTVNFNTSLSYFDVATERNSAITLYNKSEFTTSESMYNGGFSDWVATQVAVYESNERLDQAMKEVDKGNYEEAKKIVKRNEDYIKSKPAAVQKAPAMQGAAAVNAEYESKIENVSTMSEEDIKFVQKDSKNSNYKVRAKK